MSYQIYQLSDPRDNTPKYIGMSQDAEARYRQHLNSKHGVVFDWIQELRATNHVPILTILSNVPNKQEAKMAEKHWIQRVGEQYPLLNWMFNFELREMWEEREAYETWLRDRFAHLPGQDMQEAIRLTKLGHYCVGREAWEDTYDTVTRTINKIRKLPSANIPLDDIEIIRLTFALYGLSHIDGKRI